MSNKTVSIVTVIKNHTYIETNCTKLIAIENFLGETHLRLKGLVNKWKTAKVAENIALDVSGNDEKRCYNLYAR